MTCPKEQGAKKITDNTPVEVPNTAYYRRLVSEGSLILVAETIKEPSAGAPKEKRGNKA